MWAHERQSERITWPAWGWVYVLTTWPHGRNRRWCLGAVWDFIRSLCVSVPRRPRISRFANLLAWISICVPLSEHVHVYLSCKVLFFFAAVHMFRTTYLWVCLWGTSHNNNISSNSLSFHFAFNVFFLTLCLTCKLLWIKASGKWPNVNVWQGRSSQGSSPCARF